MDSKHSAQDTALQAPDDHSLRVPFYCEENAWRVAYRRTHLYSSETYCMFILLGRYLCNTARTCINRPNKLSLISIHCQYCADVCFISNREKTVPMFCQRASQRVDGSVAWDYHVIVIGVKTTDDGALALVYDIDSTLTYPTPLDDYLEETFPYETQSFQHAPSFRLIPASVYLTAFSSDRSHMFNSKTQTWNAPPPAYTCIASHVEGADTNNLKFILDFAGGERKPVGDNRLVPALLTLEELAQHQFEGLS